MGLHATESTPREWSLMRSGIDITIGSILHLPLYALG